MIKLGERVRDQISGFEGVAMGRTEWLNGCVRVAVQPKVDKDGRFSEMQWFDEPQLEVMVTRKRTRAAKNDTGGPLLSTPTRASDPSPRSDGR